MTVFISYNRKDEEFVDKLAKELILHNIPVWRDTWQLGLGDSITNSVQNALEKASFVCLVLSENALKSKWVEREITASLVRELEEQRLSILPLVIDNCTLPLFLRDKLYADFRSDFDIGIKEIITAVADKYNLLSGKITNEGTVTYFGTDVLLLDDGIKINFDIISEDEDSEYFILTKFTFNGDSQALKKFVLYKTKGNTVEYVRQIISVCRNKMIDTKNSAQKSL